jgi:hypothetical protein
VTAKLAPLGRVSDLIARNEALTGALRSSIDSRAVLREENAELREWLEKAHETILRLKEALPDEDVDWEYVP